MSKEPFGKLAKLTISVKKQDSIGKRKTQYDLMMIEGILRAHVGTEDATVIAEKSLAEEKILSAFPAKDCAKVQKREEIGYSQLLSESYS